MRITSVVLRSSVVEADVLLELEAGLLDKAEGRIPIGQGEFVLVDDQANPLAKHEPVVIIRIDQSRQHSDSPVRPAAAPEEATSNLKPDLKLSVRILCFSGQGRPRLLAHPVWRRPNAALDRAFDVTSRLAFGCSCAIPVFRPRQSRGHALAIGGGTLRLHYGERAVVDAAAGRRTDTPGTRRHGTEPHVVANL